MRYRSRSRASCRHVSDECWPSGRLLALSISLLKSAHGSGWLGEDSDVTPSKAERGWRTADPIDFFLALPIRRLLRAEIAHFDRFALEKQ